MLTAAEATGVLGVTARDLADLVTAGLLRPCGSSTRRYPVTQVEALLNRPGRGVGVRSGDVLRPTSPNHSGPGRPAPASSGPAAVGSELTATRPAEPLSSAPGAQPDGVGTSPGYHPRASRDPQSGFLNALGQALLARTGPGLGCQLRQHGAHPHLLIHTAGGAQLMVWLVWTSAGWRFLWNQWRSHTAADLPGAATAIAAELASASAATGPAPGRNASASPPGTPGAQGAQPDDRPRGQQAASVCPGRAAAQHSDPFGADWRDGT
jgi:hypothetical protein